MHLPCIDEGEAYGPSWSVNLPCLRVQVSQAVDVLLQLYVPQHTEASAAQLMATRIAFCKSQPPFDLFRYFYLIDQQLNVS